MPAEYTLEFDAEQLSRLAIEQFNGEELADLLFRWFPHHLQERAAATSNADHEHREEHEALLLRLSEALIELRQPFDVAMLNVPVI